MSGGTAQTAANKQQRQLLPLLAADAGAALGASFLVSPFICIVDRSIIQNASGAMKMGESVRAGLLELVTKPHLFFARREFGMIWAVYASTYITANVINTSCEWRGLDASWPKFLGTTMVNMASGISKDRAFTRMFGTTKPRPVPTPTYALFMIRDAGTVAASFNFPEPASEWLQGQGWSKGKADITAQMVCPAAVQILSTPLHLLGLDLYNTPQSTPAGRMHAIRTNYFSSVLARFCRIGPAFGIGGVGNTFFRKQLRAAVGDVAPVAVAKA